MKTNFNIVLSLIALIMISNGCSEQPERKNVERQLQALTLKLTGLESTDKLDEFLEYYDSQAISMPEYQLTLQGRDDLARFYREIFSRQKIVAFERTAFEFIHMGGIIAEIGSFKKEYIDSKTDSLVALNGKYWMVWETQTDGSFKLKGESFGFFHPVAHPESLIVSTGTAQPDESDLLEQKEIPFELKAYNALMEKGVRKRDGHLRSEFFTNDGSIYPFADTAVVGMTQIKPYLLEYSARGHVSIDSIMCYTFDFAKLGNYILEYDMFKVKWSVPDFSGRTEGKGIRIWKRQADGSLRLYREIGTHNQL